MRGHQIHTPPIKVSAGAFKCIFCQQNAMQCTHSSAQQERPSVAISQRCGTRLLLNTLLQYMAEGKAVLSLCPIQQLRALYWLAVSSLCSILPPQ